MKRVLITGASSGIGYQLALDYAADGWHVTACGRNRAKLETLREKFSNMVLCEFDITDLAETRRELDGKNANLVPLPRAEAYGASKAALAYFARSLAQDLKRQQIAISLVQPGFVDTPLTRRNDFAMPMMINVGQASRYIRDGLAKGKAEFAFPRLFSIILRITSRLPNAIQRLLTQQIAR